MQRKTKHKNRWWVRFLPLLAVATAVPVLMGQEEGGSRCGSAAQGYFSDEPAPDMRGTWSVVYDNDITVDIDLGAGATYQDFVSSTGGTVGFTHDGTPIDLDLDCSQPWLVCPSEVWPDTVTFEQLDFANHPHQVRMEFTEQTCTAPRMPDETLGECSLNPDDNLPCDEEICDPENVEENIVRRIASIGNPTPRYPDPGTKPEYDVGIFLTGGWAVPLANCVLMNISYADADIVYDGTYDPEEPTMIATELRAGVITLDFHGACFWGAWVGDAQLAAALLGARVTLTTGFTAVKM